LCQAALRHPGQESHLCSECPCCTWGISISHLVDITITRTVPLWHCLGSSSSILLIIASKCKSHDAGDSNMPKSKHKVLHLSENCSLNKERKKLRVEIAKNL
jgi:hypothetical protein